MGTDNNDYFVDSDRLYDYHPDSLLSTDEWEILRYKLVQELHNCDEESLDEFYLQRGCPFLKSFEYQLEKKLMEAGFERDWLRNDIWLKSEAFSRRDNYYDEPDIEAALSGLVSLRKLRDLFVTNGLVDRNAIKVFLYSLEMFINIFRAGEVPKAARTEVIRTKNSNDSRHSLKPEMLHTFLEKVFNLYPKTPKTLGGVWSKAHLIEMIKVRNNQYSVCVEQDKLFFHGITIKQSFKWAKDSIRRHIQSFK